MIDARGGGLKPGAKIDSAARLTLKEGERVTVIGPDGKAVTLRGPFSGPPMAKAAAGNDPRSALAALISTRNARTSSVGVVRGGTDAAPLPEPWLIDVSRSGDRCLKEGTRPVWWRPGAAAPETLTVMPIDRSWRADVAWASGQDRLVPPPLGKLDAQTTLVMRGGGEEHVIRINQVPADLPNDFVLASWMLEKGCMQQADALLRQIGRTQATAVPPAPTTPNRGGLMTKQLRSILTAGFVAIAATLVAVLAVQYLSFLANLENIGRDVRVAALSRPMPQNKDIVIAGLTESTVAQFPYRSPIDRGFLAHLIQALQAKGAREIGVDVLFDGPTEPAKDDELKRVIRQVKVPLFISYTNSPNVVTDDQLAYLNAFVPPAERAGANLATDPFDGSVRWIFPGETGPGMPLGFVRKALALIGIKTPNKQVEIAWRSHPDAETPAFPIYPAETIPMLPDEWIKGKIVLVGAILSITDRHRTPLAIVKEGDEGMMPGIIVQAHGIAQYLEGAQRRHPGPARHRRGGAGLRRDRRRARLPEAGPGGEVRDRRRGRRALLGRRNPGLCAWRAAGAAGRADSRLRARPVAHRRAGRPRRAQAAPVHPGRLLALCLAGSGVAARRQIPKRSASRAPGAR